MYVHIYFCLFLSRVLFIYLIILCQYSKILVYICVSKIFSSTTLIQALCRYSKILVYTCVSTILALELLFQALRQYSNILAYTCVSTIFSSRTVIL